MLPFVAFFMLRGSSVAVIARRSQLLTRGKAVHISLRSHLTAGTAAVVAVGAVAMTPMAVVQQSLPSINLASSADVALAAFASPLAQLFATADLANNYLLDSLSNPSIAANWPFADFGNFWGDPPENFPLLPSALADSALGGYFSVGLVSQIIDDALPIFSQLGYNGLGYLNITGNAVSFAGATLSQAVWTAAGQAVTGNFAGALATISAAVSDAGEALLGAGAYVFQNVAARAAAVVTTLVGALPTALGVTVAQAQVVVAKSVEVITDTFAALSGGDLEGAWNAAVTGLLGPSGVPGTLLNLSIGAGVQTGPIVTPDAAGLTAVFVPSTRTLVQTFVKDIATDLQTSPASPAATRAARSAAADRPAAVQVAPAVAAPGSPAAGSPAAGSPAAGSRAAVADTGSAAASDAPAEKRAKQRTARKAAGPRGD